MCPSYMATREEQHSTRGRAHLLWEMMQGDVLQGRLAQQGGEGGARSVPRCKACKTECPVNVDMATYKAEFLAHHYEGRLRPLHAYAFGYIDKLGAAGIARAAHCEPASRAAADGRPRQGAAAHPSFAHAAAFCAKTYTPRRRTLPQPAAPLGDVLLWADTFNNYLHAETAVAAHRVLTAGRLPRARAAAACLLRASAV